MLNINIVLHLFYINNIFIRTRHIYISPSFVLSIFLLANGFSLTVQLKPYSDSNKFTSREQSRELKHVIKKDSDSDVPPLPTCGLKTLSKNGFQPSFKFANLGD